MPIDPATVMPDEVVVEEPGSPPEGEVVEGEGEDLKTGAEGEEVVVEEEGDRGRPAVEDSQLSKENRELRAQLLEIGQELKDIRERASRAKETPKPPPEAEGALTQEQLEGLIDQHKENPQVLLRIFNYVAEQQAQRVATGIRDETVRNVEFQNWHRDLKTHNDAVMGPILQTNPELRSTITETTKRLALDQHPMGELLVHALVDYARRQGDKAKEADEAARAEKLLKQKGHDKTRSTGDKGARTKGLTKEHKDIADKLGISYESYAKFLPKEKE